MIIIVLDPQSSDFTWGTLDDAEIAEVPDDAPDAELPETVQTATISISDRIIGSIKVRMRS